MEDCVDYLPGVHDRLATKMDFSKTREEAIEYLRKEGETNLIRPEYRASSESPSSDNTD